MKREVQPYEYLASQAVASVFEANIQYGLSSERGGILLGEVYPDDRRIVIQRATEPGSGDFGTLSTWTRNAERANRLIADAWSESNGLLQYVGEWHTHAEDVPRPSGKDVRTMQKLAGGFGLVTEGLVLIIVGRETSTASYWSRSGRADASIEWIQSDLDEESPIL